MRAFSFETRNTFVIQSRAEFYLFKRVIVLQHCSKEIELNYRKVKGLQVSSLTERHELSSSFSTHLNLLRSEGKIDALRRKFSLVSRFPLSSRMAKICYFNNSRSFIDVPSPEKLKSPQKY